MHRRSVRCKESRDGRTNQAAQYPGSYEVIGINNTGNESGERCTVNNPCEIDSMGNVSFEKGASYGQQLYQVYSCVKDSGAFDLSLPGCKLQKPATP
ncbi:hypothetical protein BVG81_005580 [Haliangium sp. UPWRP_2]|nr:hypothetical protein BVG81_005580 [Haliangium sp. UPWRP_2]